MSNRVLDTYSRNQLRKASLLVKLVAVKEIADDLGIGDVLKNMVVDYKLTKRSL